NTLVTGVSGDKYALGYFGFAYYKENQTKLNVIALNSNGTAVAPSASTIASGAYSPLSRPVFIYVSQKSAERPEVVAFTNYYIRNAGRLAPEVGYVGLGDQIYEAVQARFDQRITGTLFEKPESHNQAL